MEQKPKQSTENFIKEIRRKTRRLFSSEQKLVIVMEAQRGEYSIAELCRKHGISQATFYKWNKEFMEAGKKRLSGDTTREATSDEVAELRRLNKELKELVADLLLDNNILKKVSTGWLK
jgi:transposase